MKMFRQGDVLIMQIAEKPSGEWKKERREKGRVILAAGVTGHHHAIRDRNVCLLRAEGISDAVMTVARECLLEHEEHASIAIPPGDFLVRIQREWDGALSRRVED